MDSKFFQKFKFTNAQIEKYLRNAMSNFEIARKDSFDEVRFAYCYQALLKAGITLVSKEGYKTRSVPGHHIKILEKMSDILGNPDILTYGNAMRMKRNLDLYEGGTIVSESEVKAYIKFVGEVLNDVKRRIGITRFPER